MRRLLFAANWKMNKTRAEARDFCTAFKALERSGDEGDVAIFAPFTCLADLADADLDFGFGAQDMHWEASGAYTGEVAPGMVVDAGCSMILIGHSERRGMFGETDESCRKKIDAALAADLTPVICVGETLDERESHAHMAKVAKQVRAACSGMREAEASKLIFAYEPIWAIGTGKTASDDQAQEMCAHVRSTIKGEVGSVADSIRVLYGGSMKPGNVAGLVAKPDVDGGLIGGASLKPDSFHELIVNGGAAQV
jgi:triosephosphate isomerase